jgi:hypothetical protein
VAPLNAKSREFFVSFFQKRNTSFLSVVAAALILPPTAFCNVADRPARGAGTFFVDEVHAANFIVQRAWHGDEIDANSVPGRAPCWQAGKNGLRR